MYVQNYSLKIFTIMQLSRRGAAYSTLEGCRCCCWYRGMQRNCWTTCAKPFNICITFQLVQVMTYPSSSI